MSNCSKVDEFSGSFVFYKGPSQLDRKPIVAIATQNSRNKKTGNMVQCWIMREDINPIEAMMTAQDKSVCGDCKLRKSICYVALHQAPLNIWRAYKKGDIPILKNHWMFANKLVRFGAFGDPTAVPIKTWLNILSVTKGHTSYTHQWRKRKFQQYKSFTMASCDTEEEAKQAQKMGWRTFRVKMDSSPKVNGELVCPASRDDLKVSVTCSTCLLCNGNEYGRNRNIVEDIHGIKFKTQNFAKLQDKLQNKQSSKLNSPLIN